MSRKILLAENRYSLAKERYIKAKVMMGGTPKKEHMELQAAKAELDKVKDVVK